jgi:CxxC motif-containing protein (DUF1111 family)
MLATAALFVMQVQKASTADPTARDPGVRGGTSTTGAEPAHLDKLSPGQEEYFKVGLDDFSENETVEDGLGPRMNLDSCKGCHMHPVVGGSSPATNPQFAFAKVPGAKDSLPPFITEDGPVREARFVQNRDGSPDGGVHALFTITGRDGASSTCGIRQEDFARQVSNRNVIFRIPTPVLGAGLIEQVSDASILANLDSSASVRSKLGIRGRPNFQVSGRTISGQTNNNGNDGTIARFGWKAQNKSLLLFAGEAYNVEMGITSELFQTEREETSGCQYRATPNSVSDLEATTPTAALSSIEKFAIFMRFLAPPVPSSDTPGGNASIVQGAKVFAGIGCSACHTPVLTTGSSPVAALSNQRVQLFSDLLLHDMGVGLADGVSQGQAGPREFRSSPLWGLGQRIFFLHDGRTGDLIQAIGAHASDGSEANGVIGNYLQLSEGQKQDLLNFLRSL